MLEKNIYENVWRLINANCKDVIVYFLMQKYQININLYFLEQIVLLIEKNYSAMLHKWKLKVGNCNCWQWVRDEKMFLLAESNGKKWNKLNMEENEKKSCQKDN